MATFKNRENPILEVKNLCMTFSTKKRGRSKVVKAVDNVSFNVMKGEVFGLVGESGCGKTTTGRTIIRLYNPLSGEVKYNGRVISGKLDKDTHKYITENIAMIFQDPIASLNPRMTVSEIVGEGLKIRGMTDYNERNQKVIEMLGKVGLAPEHATRYPHEFSGGQRQRIGIARALAVNPTMVIADEPVSALDVSVQAQVINLINDLKDEYGLTVLFIAHNLSVVKYFCDRIGVMYYGKRVEVADGEDLFRHPIHPYTRALLSAIPSPDPHQEKRRKKLVYDPSVHQYGGDKQPSYQEYAPGHSVYCTPEELAAWDAEVETQMANNSIRG